ncbi:MAG: CopD family copper resistance protein [Luteimonas sp.]
MAEWYPWILTLHLACAIVFIGAVAFEVLILDALHHSFDTGTMQRIEQAVMARARRVMPWVVGLLFLSGGALFEIHCASFRCLGSRFGDLLLLKVTLAFAVLAVFVRAVWASRQGGMDPCRFRHTHRTVLVLAAAIVLLAKGMFFW